MISAFLFDIDGTLVDSNDLHAQAWREAFLHFGLDIPLQRVRSQIGKGGDNLIPALLPDLDATARKRVEDYRSELFRRDYMPRVRPFPGVVGLFERIARDGIPIVLASSSNEAEVDHYIDLIGCRDLIFAATSKDEVEHSKPCPDLFEAALAKVAPVGPDAARVVGDSPYDVEAALKVGIRAIGFRSGGFPDEALLGCGATILFDGPQDMLDRYDRLAEGDAHAPRIREESLVRG